MHINPGGLTVNFLARNYASNRDIYISEVHLPSGKEIRINFPVLPIVIRRAYNSEGNWSTF